jgi:cysteinyl-tRNA synthetase
MSTKYLGEQFDIHGGGNDLKFPHHENEIAQNVGSCQHTGARYWLHTNMLLMNGRKMSKSDGNTISPQELFTGDSPHVSKGYSPMVIRFFMLQTHYRSTLDLTDTALQAAEKGYKRLMEANRVLQTMTGAKGKPNDALDQEINELIDGALAEMNDDFNTPKSLARLFELVSRINSLKGGQLSLGEVSAATLDRLKQVFNDLIFDVFGLLDDEQAGNANHQALDHVMKLVLEMRQNARDNKDWGTSDKIRDGLKEAGIVVKDEKDGASWGLE